MSTTTVLRAIVELADAGALVAAAIAVVTDARTRRIPNRLTFSAAAAGLVAVPALVLVLAGPGAAARAFATAAIGGLVGLLVFGVPGALGLVGMGDVKLATALGALVRWPVALAFVLYAALAGGAVALGHAIARGQVRAVGRNLLHARAPAGDAHRIPYALALALGCAWAIAARYVPALRLV